MKRALKSPRHVGWYVETGDDNRWRVVRPDGSMLDEAFDSIGDAHEALDKAATNEEFDAMVAQCGGEYAMAYLYAPVEDE